jgi:endo-1,4-beta-D-glucanase Y
MTPRLLLLATLAFPLAGHADARGAWPFWNSYKSHFVSAEGRVTDPDRNAMTTSEGQSYAMFFALVADDAISFERIRSWTEENLAGGNLAGNLPAWCWGRSSDGGWSVLDQNSAADADLWIAYSLLQAGALWNKPGYREAGKALLLHIANREVAQLPNAGPVLMPGRVELFFSTDRWVLNESYLPLPLLLAAAQAAPNGPWSKMAASLPAWLQRASPAGFAMDWVADHDGEFSAVSNPGDAYGHASGSYDAIRVYLWAGMTDKETPGADRILAIFSPMARLMNSSPMPPESVSPDGAVLSKSAPVGFSAALLPFLRSSGDDVSANRQLRLMNAQFDPRTGLLGTHPRYYDQNLALFALGWQEQRFRFAPDGELRVRWKN